GVLWNSGGCERSSFKVSTIVLLMCALLRRMLRMTCRAACEHSIAIATRMAALVVCGDGFGGGWPLLYRPRNRHGVAASSSYFLSRGGAGTDRGPSQPAACRQNFSKRGSVLRRSANLCHNFRPVALAAVPSSCDRSVASCSTFVWLSISEIRNRPPLLRSNS